jgi:hypothetical protein
MHDNVRDWCREIEKAPKWAGGGCVELVLLVVGVWYVTKCGHGDIAHT